MSAVSQPTGLQMVIWLPAAMGAVVTRLWFGLAKAHLRVPPGKLLTSDQPWGRAVFCIGLTFPFGVGAAAVAIRFAPRATDGSPVGARCGPFG